MWENLGFPDGRYVYYSEDVYPGGYFQYNKDPNSQIYVINRYDLQEGKTEQVTGGPGGAVRPVVFSFRRMAGFCKRVHDRSVLYIRELSTGREWPIYDQLDKDQQEAWAIFGPYTGFNFTPDDQYIIIWAGGGIQRINVQTMEVSSIPFHATAVHPIVNALHFQQDPAPDNFRVKAIRQATTSPMGRPWCSMQQVTSGKIITRRQTGPSYNRKRS